MCCELEDIVHEIIKGAVEVERDFICGALPCDLIGMNKDSSWSE